MKTAFLILFQITFAFGVFAQNSAPILPPSLQSLNVLPRESVKAHGLKPYYTAGEKIEVVFSVIEMISQNATELSIPLYVDFIDLAQGKLVNRFILKLETGKANLSFNAPFLSQTTNFQIRAYTNWMRNFSEDCFFKQNLAVFSRNYKIEIPNANKPVLDTLMAFVEGGRLVNGLKSKVAVKILNNFGEKMSAPFCVVNNRNDTLVIAETDTTGIALFDISPQVNENHRIIAHNKVFELPKAAPKGSILTVDNLSNKEKIKVFIQTNDFSANSDTLTLALIKEGQLVYWQSFQNNKSTLLISVPKKDLSGKIYCYLLDQLGEKLGERAFEILSPETKIDVLKNDRKLLCERPLNYLYSDSSYKFPIEKGLTVKGRVTRTNGKAVKQNVKLSMIVSEIKKDTAQELRQTFFVECKDEFSFANLDFFGRRKITFIAPENKVSFDTTISIPEIKSQKSTINWSLVQSPNQQAELEKRQEEVIADIIKQDKGSINLQEVEIKAKKVVKDQYGMAADKVIDGEILNRHKYAPFLLEYVRVTSCAGIIPSAVKYFVNGFEFTDFDTLVPDAIEQMYILRNVEGTPYKCSCAIIIKYNTGWRNYKRNEGFVMQGYYK